MFYDVVGYGRVALDQEVEFTGKKTPLPSVDSLKKLMESASTSVNYLRLCIIKFLLAIDGGTDKIDCIC